VVLTVVKVFSKPLGMLFGVFGGMLASAIFKQVWKRVSGDEKGGGDVPDPTDEERSWREVLPAAALQGAIFAVVKAAVDRGSAVGVRRLTGTRPG
jgi:hypothetical protein